MSSPYEFDIPSLERVILTARETMGRNDPFKLIFLFALATASLAMPRVVPALRENYFRLPLVRCWRCSCC